MCTDVKPGGGGGGGGGVGGGGGGRVKRQVWTDTAIEAFSEGLCQVHLACPATTCTCTCIHYLSCMYMYAVGVSEYQCYVAMTCIQCICQ